MNPPRVCDHCGRWIEQAETLYRMTITLVAEPGPEIELPIDPNGDPAEEFRRLIEAMAEMTEDQIIEATDQIHERYKYDLCPECRAQVHRWLKRREKIF